ncbi:hypothetical protein VTK56DRAFT_8440 [Thermocarpiscus australiensis]
MCAPMQNSAVNGNEAQSDNHPWRKTSTGILYKPSIHRSHISAASQLRHPSFFSDLDREVERTRPTSDFRSKRLLTCSNETASKCSGFPTTRPPRRQRPAPPRRALATTRCRWTSSSATRPRQRATDCPVVSLTSSLPPPAGGRTSLFTCS